jgi:reverse gyrase
VEESLVIVESPAKARTLGRYLGKGYSVLASVGHVRDLPKNELGIDVEHGFEPIYQLLPAKRKVIARGRRSVGISRSCSGASTNLWSAFSSTRSRRGPCRRPSPIHAPSTVA